MISSAALLKQLRGIAPKCAADGLQPRPRTRRPAVDRPPNKDVLALAAGCLLRRFARQTHPCTPGLGRLGLQVSEFPMLKMHSSPTWQVITVVTKKKCRG
jgi:hypothetical protein